MNKLISIIKKLRSRKDSIITYCKIALYKLKKHGKICILFSNGMGYGGAPLVLLEMAKVYKKMGYNVIVYTQYYGKLIKVYRKCGIDVWISPYKESIINKKISECKFEFAVANTVVMSDWVKIFEKKNTPIIWWIHESYQFIKNHIEYMPDQLKYSTYVAAVSDKVLQGIKKHGFDYNIDVLNYGIEEIKHSSIQRVTDEHECIYLVMGAICKNKNQKAVVRAFNAMPAEYQKKSRVIFVGEALEKNDSYYYEFLDEINGNPNIEHVTAVSRYQIPQLYNNIDVAICCSYEDSLPVVVTEALMFSKVVITSSGTGHYSLIKGGFNGYSFDVNDEEELKNKMISAYENRDNIDIRNNARLLYEQTFSLKVFQEKIVRFTNDILEKEKSCERI